MAVPFWRGRMGRAAHRLLQRQRLSAIEIQRILRGKMARKKAHEMHHLLFMSSLLIQRMFRLNLAKKKAFLKRLKNVSAIKIQKTFRGYLGKKKYLKEKQHFLFSNQQTEHLNLKNKCF